MPRRGPVYRFSTADSRARNADDEDDSRNRSCPSRRRGRFRLRRRGSRLVDAPHGDARDATERRERSSSRARARTRSPASNLRRRCPAVVRSRSSPSVSRLVRDDAMATAERASRPPPDSPLGSDLPPELSAAIEAESGATLTEFPAALVAHAVDQSSRGQSRLRLRSPSRSRAPVHAGHRRRPRRPRAPRQPQRRQPRPRRRRRRASRRRARRRHRPELAQGALPSRPRARRRRRVDPRRRRVREVPRARPGRFRRARTIRSGGI